MAERTLSFDLDAVSGAPLAGVVIVLAPDAATTTATSVVLPQPERTETDAAGQASLRFTPSRDLGDTTYSLWIGTSRWSGLTLDDVDLRADQLLHDRPADGETTPVSSQTLTERIDAAIRAELAAEGVEALGDRLDQEILDRRADVDAEGATRAAADRALGARIDAIPHQGGGQAGQSAAQVAAAIEAHRADADAHHHPPDITGLASQSDLDAEAQDRRDADHAQDNRLDAIEADDWVTSARLEDDSVGGRALGQHVVHGGGQGHIALQTVTADNIAPNTLGEATLDAEVVDKLNDRGTVTDEQLAAEAQDRRDADTAAANRLDAIEADDWVTSARLEDDSVGGRALGQHVVHGGGQGHIALGTVTADNIAPNTLGEATLDAEVVDKLNDRGTVTDEQLDAVAHAADAAAAAAQANTATINNLAVFGQYELNPGGIPGADPPDFMALTISSKRTPKIISRLRVNLGGVIVADLNRIGRPVPPVVDPLAEFNQSANTYWLSGGVVNCTFGSEADKGTFRNAVAGTVQNRPQFIHAEIQYQFTDGTSQTDRAHFGVNNNAFRAAGETEFAETVQQVAAADMQDEGSRDVAARADHVHGLPLAAGSGLSFNTSDELDHTPQVLRIRLGSMNTSGLRNGAAQALSTNFSALVMVRTLNLPTGAAYNATSGVLTLPVGLWLITGQARIVGTADRGAGHHSLAIFADPEGIDPKQAIGRVDEDSYRDADSWMQVNAVAHIVASGSNDTWAITLEALSSEGTPTATAAWLDVIKLA